MSYKSRFARAVFAYQNAVLTAGESASVEQLLTRCNFCYKNKDRPRAFVLLTAAEDYLGLLPPVAESEDAMG
jgi:hypothetical protein